MYLPYFSILEHQHIECVPRSLRESAIERHHSMEYVAVWCRTNRHTSMRFLHFFEILGLEQSSLQRQKRKRRKNTAQLPGD